MNLRRDDILKVDGIRNEEAKLRKIVTLTKRHNKHHSIEASYLVWKQPANNSFIYFQATIQWRRRIRPATPASPVSLGFSGK